MANKDLIWALAFGLIIIALIIILFIMINSNSCNDLPTHLRNVSSIRCI